MTRRAGVLLHPTSLPGSLGIGDLGPAAMGFIDWAAEAGLKLWQVLPLGPPGGNQSPYASSSAFAGDPLLTSPERLVKSGWVAAGELDELGGAAADRVDFATILPLKAALLRRAWAGFKRHAGQEARATLEAYSRAPEQSDWLDDWALFVALKQRYGGARWTEWEPELANRDPAALSRARNEFAEEIEYQRFLQCLFATQWSHVRQHAKRCGITIVGDLPFYVAHDSADVWAHRELFQLDDAGHALQIAGVPPDYFSADGQVWGNPLYRWDVLGERGYRWWISRLAANLRQTDCVRLDHFRAFAAYWRIAAGSETAVEGAWEAGPGRSLFDAAREHLGGLPFIAEDLGDITPDVRELRDALDLPGMKILQFGLADDSSEHHPGHHVEHAVVYTGTHDNDTSLGWLESLDDETRQRVLQALPTTHEDLSLRMVEAAYESKADTCIVPLQDFLSLGNSARMNLPGQSEGNWNWRARQGALTLRLAAALRELAARHQR